jgi:hypothetical protein
MRSLVDLVMRLRRQGQGRSLGGKHVGFDGPMWNVSGHKAKLCHASAVSLFAQPRAPRKVGASGHDIDTVTSSRWRRVRARFSYLCLRLVVVDVDMQAVSFNDSQLSQGNKMPYLTH